MAGLPKRRQRGAVTLVLTLILLFLVTLLVFASFRVTWYENRVSGNELRARQALDAAQAGIDHGIAYLQNAGPDQNSDSVLDDIGSQALPSSNATYDPAQFATVTDENGDEIEDLIRVSAAGASDDGTGTRTVTLVVAGRGALAGEPKQPLIVKDAVSMLSGNANVENAYANATIRAGGGVDSGGSATTYVCDGCAQDNDASTTPNEDATTGLPPDMQSLDDASTVTDNIFTNAGPDVLENDPSFAGLTGDDFFENYFTGDKNTVRAAADSYYNVADLGANAVETALEGATGELIWVDGDIQLNSNTRIGCTVSHPTQCTEATVDPVVLVVNGSLRTNGTSQVYGVVYIATDWDTNGTLQVYGTVIVEGNVEGNGTTDVRYWPDAYGGGPTNPNWGVIAGSWRDW